MLARHLVDLVERTLWPGVRLATHAACVISGRTSNSTNISRALQTQTRLPCLNTHKGRENQSRMRTLPLSMPHYYQELEVRMGGHTWYAS